MTGRAQDSTQPVEPQTSQEKKDVVPPDLPGKPGEPDKRIFGVLPNYRTARASDPFKPLTARQKLYIGYKDSTDYPIFFVSAGLAALGQLTDSHPTYGQGLSGYGRRLAGSLADQAIGNMMAESFIPALTHTDPRYFQINEGTVKHRLFYALTRVLVTKTDSGRSTFNIGEIGGNAIATAIGTSYYPDNRSVKDAGQQFGVQIATDAFSNVLKEFWPDIKRHYFHKHSSFN